MKLGVLAESIANSGLNPMDRWLVLKSPAGTDYIVYEGNRRLAALKLLAQPTLIHSLSIPAPLTKRFEKLAKTFASNGLVPAVDCFVIPDRETGAQWLQQRHTGENGGRGIVQWSGVATARFRGSDPALQALDFVLAKGGLQEDEKAEILENFPITTLDRLLSAKAFRKGIGVDVKDRKLFTNLPEDQVVKPLTRIVRDLASGKVTVSDLKNQTQQATYLSNLGKDLPNLKKATSTDTLVENLSKGSGAATAKVQAPSKPQKPSTPPPRKSVIPRQCKLAVSVSKIHEIEKELRSLELDEAPHAISVMLRVFLELSVDHYLTTKGISLTATTPSGVKDKSLKVKITAAIAAMIGDGVPKKHLDGIANGIHDSKSPLFVDTLHNYVHNRFYSPKIRDLTVAWDNSQPFFQEIWK
ncbi:MAG: hypothetical protein EOO15_18465 [Chitinophagaceae bacterium]|nr:MAG: hypothetical protein EOO15_18465 [Chitinophagaceae bacterium]